MKNPQIERAVFNTPWLITPEYLDTIASVVTTAMASAAERGEPKAYIQRPLAAKRDSEESDWFMENGVAVIPIVGAVSKRMNLFQNISGGTSIQQISKAFDEALASEARAIVFETDSPGGSVDGGFEFAEKIRRAVLASDKLIVCYVNGSGCSLAYLFASQCDQVYCSVGSNVGSIGVVMKMTIGDRAEKNQGFDSVVIRSDSLKGIGLDFPSNEQLDEVKARVTEYTVMLRRCVTLARPQVDCEGIRSKVFSAVGALKAGLVDEVISREALMSRYARK